jgi:hypothetical protein
MHRWSSPATPGFDGAEGFPGDSLEEMIGPFRRRLDWIPMEWFVFDPATLRDCLIDADRALTRARGVRSSLSPGADGVDG